MQFFIREAGQSPSFGYVWRFPLPLRIVEILKIKRDGGTRITGTEREKIENAQAFDAGNNLSREVAGALRAEDSSCD